MEFKKVFEPIQIGKFKVRNRIQVSPAEPFLATRDGLVTDEFIKYTVSMARGGAGIVTIGDSAVTQAYAEQNHYAINLADPFVAHGLFKLTDAIHRYGAIASIELNLREEYDLGALTLDEIHGIQDDFASAAERCAKGGFDMVMIHCGHGHVVANFFSPQHNTRTDEYGCQTLENRCRFASELLAKVREKIGPDMAIEIRMSGDELTEGGVGVEDAVKIAKYLEPQIDLVNVSAGNLYNLMSMPYMIQSTYVPMATNVRFAERFKAELDIPVSTVGSFTMELAEQALEEGKADVVTMIRAFIADHDQVNKAADGKADEIRPCLRCCICTGDDPHGCPKPLRCSVNAVAGREMEFDVIEKVAEPKTVAVIGGGCAGMEAARRLSERGHKPILFEASDRLGGMLIPAGDNPLKINTRAYREWSVRMTERDEGIDLRLGTEATPEAIAELAPDAIIVAVGSDPIVPPIPGIDGPNVVLAEAVDTGEAECGKSVVIVGAGLTGTETAVALAQEGHEVVQIDMLTLDFINSKPGNSATNVFTLRGMAAQLGIDVLEQRRLTEVRPDGVLCVNADGAEEFLPCDTVVLSLGLRGRRALAESFRGIVRDRDLYIVGDCNKVGNITSAVREAFFAAMNI